MAELLELPTPSFLAAMPQVDDPFFHRSLVLVLEHGDEGTFGLIVNRPTGLQVSEVLDGLEIEWAGDEREAFFGGPVQPQRGCVLLRAPSTSNTGPDWSALGLTEDLTEVQPGLGLTHSSTDLTVLAARPPRDFRLVLGSAGWAPGQLAEELERSDWIPLPVDPDLIFADASTDAWHVALVRAGIQPQAIVPLQSADGEALAN